jgi:hypothetical protein
VSRKRRPLANESAGSSDSSPDPSELDEEKRAILRDVVRQAGIKPTREIIGRLIAAIQPLMAEFRQAVSQSTRRGRHDALRALLRLVDEKDPPVAVIRKRIAEIEAVDIAEAEEKAHRLWSRIFPGQTLDSGFDFVVWSQTAPKAMLLEAVPALFSDGGAVVQGRARPSGKRSRSRLEPHIAGQVRGATPSTGCTESPPSPPGSGRPRSDAEDDLVMHLAMAWHRITRLEVPPGRSDQTPFGAFVHHVFGWLGVGTAEQSLRRYWEATQADDDDPD